MNLHYLELFYHVGCHGGIAAACRKMSYGIQQPAVSAQLIKFEQQMGVRLFHRKPFSLTLAGQRLYESIAPFFNRLDEIENEIKGVGSSEIRIAGPADFFKDFAPDMLAELRKSMPKLSATLYERRQAESSAMLLSGQIDVAVVALESSVSSALNYRKLASLPLVLLTKQNKKTPDAGRLLNLPTKDRPPLISLPKGELISTVFHQEMSRRKLAWKSSIEAGSLDCIVHYVRKGMGVGLSVQIPGRAAGKDIVEHELKGFPEIEVGVLWREGIGQMAAKYLTSALRQ